MLGAIIGDIVGSRFEFSNTNRLDFTFWGQGCDYTDDSICTIAVADALLNQKDMGQTLWQWCRAYPDPMGAYGARFMWWVLSENPQPYNSFGNGSAMRVSPCGWLPTHSEVLAMAKASAECTHNHPEGIKGAQCVADAIFQLRQGMSQAALRDYLSSTYGYSLTGDYAQMQRDNVFDETCQVTVPQAIFCFLESDSFEQAIRLAVALGGDSDTIAAIAGSLAEAHFGIPEEMVQKALQYLDDRQRAVVKAFYARYGASKN